MLNVVQAFIFHSKGGCGLSIFTDLLQTSLGEELHKCFDPAVLMDEEELRKVVETMADGIVFTAQERPQGGKRRILLHLWKKLLSADGLRGRMPYAILTRMIRILGWTRVETNSVLDFLGVSEGEFESIMRRSLVITVHARMFDRQYLEKAFPDHDRHGIFARDPSLEQKFKMRSYAEAWNRTQHQFEEQTSLCECFDIIVHYSRGGGDRGATEAFMRDCCRLKRREDTQLDNFAQGILGGVQVATSPECNILSAPSANDPFPCLRSGIDARML